MAQKCYVLEGKFKGERISAYSNCIYLPKVKPGCKFNKLKISSYQVLDENSKDSKEYSFWKGALGVVLLGGIGAVAGIGGKKKSTKEYLISVEWKDGEKSLILLDDKCYKVFVQSMF